LRVEISGKRKEKKKSLFVINVSKAQRHRERETEKYKLNGEFFKSEVPGVCATIRGG
jgi:hypothetical protein